MRLSRPAAAAALMGMLLAGCSQLQSAPAREDAATSCENISTFADGKQPSRILHVSIDGSDDAGDGSPAKPFRTVARAARAPQPGTAIYLHAGTHPGGVFLTGLRGTEAAPVWIAGAPDEPRPVLEGGGDTLHLVRPRYIVIQHLEIRDGAGNGLNIDDGDQVADEDAARFVVVRDVDIHDTGRQPSGVADCLKLSGVNDFAVLYSTFARCGRDPASGAVGVGGVGVHRGAVRFDRFTDNGYGGVQFKGGSDEIEISSDLFENTGWRGVNMGGRTGEAFFRPPLSPSRANYEAARLRVQASVFVGSEAAVSFTGCVNCEFSHNTVIDPAKWAVRILQETVSTPRYAFAPASDGRIAENIFYFRRSDLNAGEDINVGAGTDASSFSLIRNLWYAHDQPRQSDPRLGRFDGSRTGSLIGRPPDFVDVDRGVFRLGAHSVAAGAGDRVFAPRADFAGHCYHDPPNLGALQ